MSNKLATINLTPEEYKILEKIAEEKNSTVNDLIKIAVEKNFLNRKKSRFDELRAFGMWAKDPRNEEEILDETGGDWSNFPVQE